MKLVTFIDAGTPTLGAVLGERVVDLPRAVAASPAGAQQAGFPASLRALLAAGDAAMQTARDALAWLAADGAAEMPGLSHPLNETRLAPPVPDPSKIVCCGQNYADHCREQNKPLPKNLILFSKFPTTLIGPGDAITWAPGSTEQPDYEAELAFVVGKTARNVPVEEAYDYIAGYTNANDVSARDVQFGDGQWIRGKSFDTFCPLGPYLVTADEVGDPHTLGIRCRLNGRTMQDSSTAELVFDVPTILSFISRTATLLPGDVVLTGTPAGVGVFRDPPIFLQPGDVVEIEIDKLGTLRNVVQ
ncbi:MAG: fumarylacetoacetate hydrolase family protein [Caldilineales bacterium]